MSELDLELFERSFLKGDFVKHSLDDPESAVVIDISSECKLEHVISGQRLDGWIPWTALRNDVRVEAKDKVVYDEWIGTIEEVSLLRQAMLTPRSSKTVILRRRTGRSTE